MKLINCHHIKKRPRKRKSPTNRQLVVAPDDKSHLSRRETEEGTLATSGLHRSPGRVDVVGVFTINSESGVKGDGDISQLNASSSSYLPENNYESQSLLKRKTTTTTRANNKIKCKLICPKLLPSLITSLMCLLIISDFQQQIANQCAQNYKNTHNNNNNSDYSSTNWPLNKQQYQSKLSYLEEQTSQFVCSLLFHHHHHHQYLTQENHLRRRRRRSQNRIEGSDNHANRGGLFVFVEANSDANRLYEDLMMTYNRIVRPVQNNSDRVVVKLSLKLSQLIDVNLKNQMMTTNVWLNQEWSDYKLKWDPSEYGGIEDINVPAEQIWLPDIVLYNSAEGYFAVSIMTKAKVRYDGHVTWNPPAIFRSSCQIDITYFPFDSQNCHLKFGSWTFGTKIDLRHINDTEQSIERGTDLSEYYQNVEWDIMQASAKRNVITYTCCPNDFYPDVTFNFTLRRKPLFYTVNLILPCVGITILSFLVFYLPSDSGEKVTLTISILVSLIFFLSVLIETIPSTSLAMPLLGKYLVFTMILITLSVCATVCVLNIHFRTPSTHSMSPWVKRWCIDILPKYLFMIVPQHQSQQAATILPEQLIYPHNQVYWSNAHPMQQPVNNNLAREANGCGKNQQQQQFLNPNSLETDLLVGQQKLNVSPSSLFLPYLQSEAARRLQLQRSRSSDRDQRSECLAAAAAATAVASSSKITTTSTTPYSHPNNNTNNSKINNSCDSQDSVSRQHNKSSTITVIDMQAANNSGTSSNSNSALDSRSSNNRNKKQQIRGKRLEKVKKGKQHFWSNWFGGNKVTRRTPEVEIHSADNNNNSARGARLNSLKQETSSSFEEDYQHHNHFQARASICSTNLWRIGPTRRCSMAMPNNYPSFYRPQLLPLPHQHHPTQQQSNNPDGRTSEISTVSGCINQAGGLVQGHYHRHLANNENDNSDSTSSALGGFNGAIGALVTASATQLPIRPKSVGPSPRNRFESGFDYQRNQYDYNDDDVDDDDGDVSNTTTGNVMRNFGLLNQMPPPGTTPLGSSEQTFPTPEPNLPPPAPPTASHLLLSNQNLQRQQHLIRRQQQLLGQLTSSGQTQQQQHSSGLLLDPVNLAGGGSNATAAFNNPQNSSSGQTNSSNLIGSYRVNLSGGNGPMLTTASTIGNIQQYAVDQQQQQQLRQQANNIVPNQLFNNQQYQAPINGGHIMPRSRSTDHRLCVYATNGSNPIYLPAGQGLTHQQLRSSASAQTTSANLLYQRQNQAPQLYQIHQQQAPLSHLFTTRPQTMDNTTLVKMHSQQAANNSYCLQEPQSIGRALGQAYMQRLQRQPTIYSLNSSTNQRPSRSNQRGAAYTLSAADGVQQHRYQHHQQLQQQQQLLNYQQSSIDKMRRSKSQNSLDRRGPSGFSGPSCAECNSLRRTEGRLKATMSSNSESQARAKLTQDPCFCGSKQRLNSMGLSQVSSGAGGSLRCRNPKDLCSSRGVVQRCCSTNNQPRHSVNQQRPVDLKAHNSGCQLVPQRQQKAPITELGLMKLISEVDKAIQNAMFIAQHIDNLDEFESVKENWKYIAMVIDRIFLIVFLVVCIAGTVFIFAMVPWSVYTTEKPIDLQLTRLLALNLTSSEPYSRTCHEF